MNSTYSKNSNQIEIEKMRDKIITDKAVRRHLVFRSHVWFSLIFLNHHFGYKFAPFQKEMFLLTEDTVHNVIAIMAFRGGGKSTIISLSYVLWAILGIQQKKCVVIISKSQQQVKTLLSHICHELENNKLLRDDLGPFKIDNKSEWGALSIELPLVGARIIAISSGQSIRGIKHGQHRPDLIIIDDIEDAKSISLRERDETYQWFQSEILPIGDGNTKIMIIGNLVHANSFMMNIKENIEKGRLGGIFRAYPLLDKHEKILWPEKFSTPESIKTLQEKLDDYVWRQEYLLHMGAFRYNLRECDKELIAHFPAKEKIPCPCKRLEPTSPFMAGYCIDVPIVNEDLLTAAVRKMLESPSKKKS